MDPKNYDEFAPFFDAVCEAYHHGGGKIHKTSWSLDGVAGLPADGVLDLRKLGYDAPVSMRVRVGRNLTSFPLPGLMTKADRINFEKTMLKVCIYNQIPSHAIPTTSTTRALDSSLTTSSHRQAS